VRIVNRRNGAVLAERVERATRIWDRMRGLLGRRHLPQGDALAIDAAFLDRDGKVIHALRDLRPYRATRIHRSAAQVVELPAGTLARTDTRAGDEIAFEV